MSAIWAVAVLPVLVGFCSLGVDWGHALLVKTELQTAADAAARYAVTGIASGVSAAQGMAVDAANDNTADGTPVVLDPSTDVEFGTWDAPSRTFTVLTGSARSGANSMRITARRTAATGNAVQLVFAALIGKPTADVQAVAVATIDQANAGGGYGVVGLGSVTIKGTPLIDSYNSSSGAYSATTARNNGTVVSNGWIDLRGNATINGDVHAGKAAGVNSNGGTTVTGAITSQASDANFPMPALPGSYTSLGAVSLKGSKALTLSAGNYYATSFDVSADATVNVTGQVTLYVDGPFGVGGNAKVNVLDNLPRNFRVRMLSGATVSLGASEDLYADIYAPQSPLDMSGSGDLYGAAIMGQIAMKGGGGIHYDETLGYGTDGSGGEGATGKVSLVK